MAATVPSNPYEVLIRKIGYSVGLEDTLNRILQLAMHYVQNLEISTADWSSIVHTTWKLKTDNIKDVFKSLNIIQVKTGSVHILPTLDEMAIAKQMLADSVFVKASKFIFLKQLLLSDGDIFLNCLSAQFARDLIEKNLKQMIRYKRSVLLKASNSRDFLDKIFRIVSIDIQKTNTGGAVVNSSLSSRRRTEPLVARTTPLTSRPTIEPDGISEDYFRKVPPKRRAWAQSVDLCSEAGELTPKGVRFLEFLRKKGLDAGQGAFAFWPLRFELAPLRLPPESIGIPDISSWDYLIILWESLVSESSIAEYSPETHAKGIQFIHEVYHRYRSLSPSRLMLRQELPVHVLFGLAFATSASCGSQLLPLNLVLKHESTRKNRSVFYRPSRSLEGAVSVRR